MFWVLASCFVFVLLFLRILTMPKVYPQENVKNIDKYLYALYFLGNSSHDIWKNGHLILNDDEKGKKHILLKYKEKGRYGIYFIMCLCEKSVEIEAVLSFLNMKFHYEEVNTKLCKYTLYVDLGADIDAFYPMIVELSTKTEIFNEMLVFDITFINVSPDPDNYRYFNKEDAAILKVVKNDIRIPTTYMIWIVDRARKKIFKR